MPTCWGEVHAMTGNVEGRLGRSRWKTRFLTRTMVFGALWWILASGDASSWWIGVPAVGFAAAVSLLLPPAPGRLRLSPSGLALFLPFFLFQSLQGGIDVMRRVFHPRLPLEPALICYRLGLGEASARVFMANAVSLLPGTLSADLDGHQLMVHTLDARMPVREQLRELELRVGRVFGVSPGLAGPLG